MGAAKLGCDVDIDDEMLAMYSRVGVVEWIAALRTGSR